VSDKSEFALRPGVGPKITRKVGGRIVEEYLHSTSAEDEVDELLQGITRHEAAGSGGRSGFGKFADGRDLTSIPDGKLHFDLPDSDILMQPDTAPPREEGDFVDTDAPKRRNETDQSANPEDEWDLEFYENYNDRNREKGHGTPPFLARKGGSVEVPLDDEIDDLFK